MDYVPADTLQMDIARVAHEAQVRFAAEVKLRFTEEYYLRRLLDARGETLTIFETLPESEQEDVRSQVEIEHPYFVAVVQMVEQLVDPTTEQAMKILEMACKAFGMGVHAGTSDIFGEAGRRPWIASPTGIPRLMAF